MSLSCGQHPLVHGTLVVVAIVAVAMAMVAAAASAMQEIAFPGRAMQCRHVTQNVSQVVLAPPSLSYKPVTPRPCDRGNISHDPTHASSRDPFATHTSRDLSARDPGNLRPRDPGKIPHDLSRNWSSTMSPDKTRFGRASNPLINTWQIVGTINKTCPLNNQQTRDATRSTKTRLNQRRRDSLGLDPNRDVLCNPQLLRIDCTVPPYL